MKTYQVELKRVSYVTFEVEADSLEKAEDAGWLELQTSDYNNNWGGWDLESITEVTAWSILF